MADDRKRQSQPYGVPLVERNRAGSHSDHSERRSPATGVPEQTRSGDDLTPVTMIQLVREELKDDIRAVDDKVDVVVAKVDELGAAHVSVVRSVERLTGAVETTNKLLPDMMTTIRDELRARRSVDEQVTLSRVQVNTHREIASIDTDAIVKRAKVKAWLKIVGAIATPAVIGALVAYAATHC